MELDPQVRAEWHDTHMLSPPTLRLIQARADPGDAHPIVSAVDALRAECQAGPGAGASTAVALAPEAPQAQHEPAR